MQLCGDGTGVDPRACCKCLRACDPAVFLLHQTFGAQEADPCDPQAVAHDCHVADAVHERA